jgi:hypothetical protein
VPNPGTVDRVLLFDPNAGSFVDLIGGPAPYKFDNNFRVVPPAVNNASGSSDFFLGSSDTRAASLPRLPRWNEPIPDGWQTVVIAPLPTGFGGGGGGGGKPASARQGRDDDDDVAESEADAFRLFVLDVEPDQEASRVGRLIRELSDEDQGGAGAARPGFVSGGDQTDSPERAAGAAEGAAPSEQKKAIGSPRRRGAPAPAAPAVGGRAAEPKGESVGAAGERGRDRAAVPKAAAVDKAATAAETVREKSGVTAPGSDRDQEVSRETRASTPPSAPARVRIVIVVPVSTTEKK